MDNQKEPATFYLKTPLIEWVATYAQRTKRSKSAVVEMAVEMLASRAGAEMQDLAAPDNGGALVDTRAAYAIDPRD